MIRFAILAYTRSTSPAALESSVKDSAARWTVSRKVGGSFLAREVQRRAEKYNGSRQCIPSGFGRQVEGRVRRKAEIPIPPEGREKLVEVARLQVADGWSF